MSPPKQSPFRHFLRVALWECLAISAAISGVLCLRRSTVAATALAVTLFTGAALFTIGGILQTRVMLAELTKSEASNAGVVPKDRSRNRTA